MASLTRLRPSVIPARRKSVRQVLLDGTRAGVELSGDFLVAATLHQQLENLFDSLSNFDFVKIGHDSFLADVFRLR